MNEYEQALVSYLGMLRDCVKRNKLPEKFVYAGQLAKQACGVNWIKDFLAGL